MKDKKSVIGLVGNPNSGKSSLFNQLTGLKQKTGNFPGVTVEKKYATVRLSKDPESSIEVTVIDFPGTYSVYPKSLDEIVLVDVLANPSHEDYPNVLIVVADAANLRRNLLLFTEISDLGVPVVLALNMLDVAESMHIKVNAVQLAMKLNVPVVKVNARDGVGLDDLRRAMIDVLNQRKADVTYFYDPSQGREQLLAEVSERFSIENKYLAQQYVNQHDNFSFLTQQAREEIDGMMQRNGFNKADYLTKETVERYKVIDKLVDKAVTVSAQSRIPKATRLLDNILLHPVLGYISFFLVLLLVFQMIFSWATYPADAIDSGMSNIIAWLKDMLPVGPLTDLLTDGVLAGIAGIVVFIPQIALLYMLVGVLEESGYMARVMVLMDKLMRKFGLNGRSVVPLISGVACAVPAIMSTRSIRNRKSRLITILVTPLMSCSARLPIFTILIALVVPATTVLGFLNLQGLVLFGTYVLGFVAALATGWILKVSLKVREPDYFIMEMPTYKAPRWTHIGIMVYDSVRAFIVGAGKVILAISIVLWVIASYGPGDSMEKVEAVTLKKMADATPKERDNAVASARLESSYAGRLGHLIEPAIRPLGYDWKIGIALITSFAAREVFVGTMSTIYSIGAEAEENPTTVKERLRQEKNLDTGGPMYTPAVSFSLITFYVFAMMCMSTLATVRKETASWKWTFIQLAYTMVLAWVSAFAVYQWLS